MRSLKAKLSSQKATLFASRSANNFEALSAGRILQESRDDIPFTIFVKLRSAARLLCDAVMHISAQATAVRREMPVTIVPGDAVSNLADSFD
jgi:hypothetical protein